MSGKLDNGEEDRSTTLCHAWDLSLQLLSTKINTVAFESFIRSVHPLRFEDGKAVLGVTSAYHRDRLEKTHLNAIRSALEFHLDATGIEIAFQIMQAEARQNASRRAAARKQDPSQTEMVLDAESEASRSHSDAFDGDPVSQGHQPPTRHLSGKKQSTRKGSPEPLPVPCLPLTDRYKIADFMVGASNRLAFAGAQAVTERPGSAYNPLFVYGGPGLGKTHLLQSIAHAIKERNPAARVSYVSGEYFAQSYIRSLREHTTETFRRQYREVDVWIVDDVQFISGKEQTKEEFFHTFNSLYHNGSQIVIGSDRSPRELSALDERLRSRLESGLIADITAPDMATRLRFLENCRSRERADVPDDVLHYIAGGIESNMRALEGALTRLLAYASIMNASVTQELAGDVLGNYFVTRPIRSRTLTPEIIIEETAQHFGVTADAVKSPARQREISVARQVAMLLCRELLDGVNLALIGRAFDRDHATVIYSATRIRTIMEIDSGLKAMVQDLRTRLAR